MSALQPQDLTVISDAITTAVRNVATAVKNATSDIVAQVRAKTIPIIEDTARIVADQAKQVGWWTKVLIFFIILACIAIIVFVIYYIVQTHKFHSLRLSSVTLNTGVTV